MLVSPSPMQKKKLLENIILPDESDTAEKNRGEPAHSVAAPDALYSLSPYAHLYQAREHSALFHALNLKVVYGDAKLQELCRRMRAENIHVNELHSIMGTGSRKDIALLVEKGFLVPSTENSHTILRKHKKELIRGKPHIGLLYMLLTNTCNMRCRYCYIENTLRKPASFTFSMLKKEQARRAIDLFEEIIDDDHKEIKLVYHGGEPFLNEDTLYDSLEYLREKSRAGIFAGRPVKAMVITNGTRASESQIPAMRRLALDVSISLDGMKHHHDAMRVFEGNRGSWEECIKGYLFFRKNLGSCGLSCTVGSHNHMDLAAIVEFFTSKLECRAIGFNVIKGLAGGSAMEAPAGELAKQLVEAYKICRRFGIIENKCLRRIRPFVYEKAYPYDCSAYGGQLAVCADGVTGPCHHAADDHRSLWGHIEEPGLAHEILRGKLTRRWCRRTPFAMVHCTTCAGLGICGGGCAEEAFVKSGDINALDKNHCIHIKYMIEWMIGDLAEKLVEAGEMQELEMYRD